MLDVKQRVIYQWQLGLRACAHTTEYHFEQLLN